ncbi:Mef2p [Sugiyamaella lignohabitans]|uniref:Ribosome-releasing factor 2, mitochondrial n=1 Tax=Sugiyamaella lignohabitans TaxID=796027 RepID=A0A167ERQ2_9ASCO|nr:Mef2p [Sugiyamaella lignohabitans]ANB14392.1 Mef2p [Sugiyamaella lignohabitans]
MGVGVRLNCFSILPKFVLAKSSIYKYATAVPHGTRFYSVSRPCFSESSAVRNIGIIAHIDAGKTTTTERMLYYSGLTSHIGDVDQGDTVTDYLQAERERGITITSAAVTLDWSGHKINLIDTPGHADFTFEVIRSIRVLDGAVTVLDGVAGVEAQTEKVWRQASDRGIPKIVFINKMDRPGAGFGRTVREVVAKLNTRVGITNFPYFGQMDAGHEGRFQGVVDVVDKRLILWDEGSDGKSVKVSELEDGSELSQECERIRTSLIETLCECEGNDDLVEEVLEISDYMAVPPSSIRKALRNSTLREDISPVLCGASFRNIGVQPLMEAVVNYLPSPEERKAPDAISKVPVSKGKHAAQSIKSENVTLNVNDPKLTCALAFKVVNDPIRGILVYVRVYSGTLQTGSVILNTTNGKKERVSKLLQMQADMPLDISKIEKGNIGVIVGSKEIRTGDTLVAHGLKKDGITTLLKRDLGLHLHPIDVPPPVFFASITPKSISDTRNMEEALDILLREDPSLRLSYDDDSGQTLLSGMGELHLEIARDRLINDLKAKVKIGPIMISYKESIQASSKIIEKSYSEGGNEDMSVKVGLMVEPVYEDIELGDLAEKIDPHDNHYVIFPSYTNHPHLSQEEIYEAIKIGIIPALATGGKLARLPLHSISVKITNLEIPEDCTSTASISSAVRLASQEALRGFIKSDYVIMEPKMDVRVVVNEEDIGNVVNDISSTRRGHVISLNEDDAENSSDQTSISNHFKELAASVYVPPDYTMYMSKHGDRATSQQSLIKAKIPLRKMVGYLTSLRSMTQGRATFLMSFDKYEIAPPDAIDEIVDSL